MQFVGKMEEEETKILAKFEEEDDVEMKEKGNEVDTDININMDLAVKDEETNNDNSVPETTTPKDSEIKEELETMEDLTSEVALVDAEEVENGGKIGTEGTETAFKKEDETAESTVETSVDSALLEEVEEVKEENVQGECDEIVELKEENDIAEPENIAEETPTTEAVPVDQEHGPEEIMEDDPKKEQPQESSLLEEALKRRKDNNLNGNHSTSLNKLEDVADESCGEAHQPSSPGHAEQRVDLTTNDSHPDGTAASIDEDEGVEDDDDEEDSGLVINANCTEKRKNAAETDDDDSSATVKKIKSDVHMQELYLRNKILKEYTDSLDTGNVNDMEVQAEQLLAEIQNLEEIAKEKEREWNNVIHMRKMKEELLLRLQRQRQVCLLSNGLEITENHEMFGNSRSLLQSQQKRRLNNNNNNSSNKAMEIYINGVDGNKGRKGPVRDVQSIIADYRQQHPESVPRRGRRIRNVNGTTTSNEIKSGSGSVVNYANIALGSGARIRHNVDNGNDVTLYLSSSGVENDAASVTDPDPNRVLNLRKDSSHSAHPEVTVHAVQASPPTLTNNASSLLHGILTKSAAKQESGNSNSSRTTFSPTLARLLTAPDKSSSNNAQQSNHHHQNNSNTKSSNVSISDILNTNKGRSEITITPVGSDYPDDAQGHQQQHQTHHLRRGKNQVDEETEDSVDRLVIDESNDLTDSRTDNNSDDGASDEVPQCQGCNQKAAQFVCAGCSNQWYCSRECQVNAWDEHSEMCSG